MSHRYISGSIRETGYSYAWIAKRDRVFVSIVVVVLEGLGSNDC
jgi:hypothetical protein